MRKLSLTYLIFLIPFHCYAQGNSTQTAFWKLTSLNGEFNLKGVHLGVETNRNSIYENSSSSYMTGGLFLNSRSFFWHPNFLALNIDAGYSPETGQQLSLLTPDRSEVNTLKKLNASISLFQYRPLNLQLFTNMYEGYSNRENLTNIKSKSLKWGSVFTYNNKILPFFVSYNKTNSELKEIKTDRTYKIENLNIEGRVNKSFGSKDNHKLVVSQNNYVYNDDFKLSEQNQTANLIENNITSLNLKNNVFLDSKKRYRYNSTALFENQKGSYYNYQRLQIIENLSFKLPGNFELSSSYNYFDVETNTNDSKQQNIRGILSHQLYESLRTSATLEFNSIKSSQFQQKDRRSGINISYTKKIPLKGLLSVSYSLKSNQQNRSSDNALLRIQNEEYRLTDSQMVLLLEQNVNAESVIVKDETGTVIYELYIDYILIERNELLEIQRIPGGKIANNSIVLIDYTSTQARSYQYNAIHNNLFAKISFFDTKIELYFKNSKQDYIKQQNIDFLTLDYFNQKVYGGRINFGFINGGIEQDNFQSTIVPYRLTRYYFVLQGKIKQKLLFTLNGTIRDYQMIMEEGKKQQYYNLTGNVAFIISKSTKLNIQANYLKQNGIGIDLDLLTSRIEFNTRYHQLFIKAGFELYKSKLYTENLDYKKFLIQISRKF